MIFLRFVYTFLAVWVMAGAAWAEDEVAKEKARIAACLKPSRTIQLPNAINGQYFRVAKDLSWVIGTIDGKSRFWRRKENGKYEEETTPLAVEPFPVEPCQELIASPQHEDGMHYYRARDLGNLGKKQIPMMTDRYLDGFYGSFGGTCTGSKVSFRSLLWNGLRSRTCTLDFSTKSSKCTTPFPICYNLFPSLGLTQIEFHRLDSVWRYLSSIGKSERWKVEDLNSLPASERQKFGYGPDEDLYKTFTALKDRVRSLEADHGLDRPILSKDGKVLMAYEKGPLHLFKIHDDGTCDRVELPKKFQFNWKDGKPTGSYKTHDGLPRYIAYTDPLPYGGKLAPLIGIGESSIGIYDTKRMRAIGLPIYPNVGQPNTWSQLFSYPSFVDDDNVVAFDQKGTGYIIDVENAFECYLGNPLNKPHGDADRATTAH